jgi:hypothetical protein
MGRGAVSATQQTGISRTRRGAGAIRHDLWAWLVLPADDARARMNLALLGEQDPLTLVRSPIPAAAIARKDTPFAAGCALEAALDLWSQAASRLRAEDLVEDDVLTVMRMFSGGWSRDQMTTDLLSEPAAVTTALMASWWSIQRDFQGYAEAVRQKSAPLVYEAVQFGRGARGIHILSPFRTDTLCDIRCWDAPRTELLDLNSRACSYCVSAARRGVPAARGGRRPRKRVARASAQFLVSAQPALSAFDFTLGDERSWLDMRCSASAVSALIDLGAAHFTDERSDAGRQLHRPLLRVFAAGASPADFAEKLQTAIDTTEPAV